MPGTSCAVAICKNNNIVARKKGLNISFHRFPKEKKLRKLWISSCQRKDLFNPETSFVCSDHFLHDDYECNLQTELMGIPTRKALKKTVVPSIKLYWTEETETRKQIVEPRIRVKKFDKLHDLTQHVLPRESLEEKYNKLLQDHQSLQIKYRNINNNKQLKNKLSIALSMATVEKSVRQSLEVILTRFFSEAEINNIEQKKKGIFVK